MKDCCEKCFGNTFIRRFIRQADRQGPCAYCSTRSRAIRSVAEVGAFIRVGLEKAYCHPVHEMGPYDHEDKRYMWGDPEDCESLLDVLSREAFMGRRAHNGGEEELARDLIVESGPSWHDVAEGASDEFGDINDPIAVQDGFFGREYTGFDSSWDVFKYRVSHVARFFDIPVLGAPRRKLLGPIARLARRCGITAGAGGTWWRARRVDNEKMPPESREDWRDAVGAAPLRLAVGNRMSPPGISYTYLADSPEACIAEVDALDGRAWLGQFILERDLRILDLTGRTIPTLRSVFDPKYNHKDLWARDILADFAKEISRPVSRKDEGIDFVPTQVLAEFFRVSGWEGIRYRSEKHEGGVNVVLFYGPKVKAPESLTAEEVGSTPYLGGILRLARFREVKNGEVLKDLPCRES